MSTQALFFLIWASIGLGWLGCSLRIFLDTGGAGTASILLGPANVFFETKKVR